MENRPRFMFSLFFGSTAKVRTTKKSSWRDPLVEGPGSRGPENRAGQISVSMSFTLQLPLYAVLGSVFEASGPKRV